MTTKHLFLILFITSLSTFSFAKQKPILQVINESLEFSVQQSKGLFEKMVEIPERLPRTVNKNGELVTAKDNWWTSGFFPGTLWYLYEYSTTDDLKQAAQAMTHRVEKQQFTTDNHDVGFMIYCSYGNGFRLSKEKSYEQVIFNAAKSLSTRFNPKTGTIK